MNMKKGPGSPLTVTFGICFKQHFDTRYLVFYNPSPPRMFLSLDLHSEYRIQHSAVGSLYVTSSYSTWIFCRGVSGFATDWRLVSWIDHLPPACWSTFWKSILNNSWAVGVTWWIVYLIFFVFWHMQLYMSWYIISFLAISFFLNSLYFFKYSCTNIFHRRSLYTFYSIWIIFNPSMDEQLHQLYNVGWNYRKVSNIRRTKYQNLNDSRLVLQLSVPNPLKPSVKSIMKM